MASYNILLIGSGGREHALAGKITESPLCNQLYIAPGNGGTQEFGENVDLNVSDFEAVGRFIKNHHITYLVVGPEGPLVEGITDFFQTDEWADVHVIGPDAYAAQLEGSKAFAKKFMKTYDIPTAAYLEVTKENINQGIDFLKEQNPPYVLKADGLAAGKGVLILSDLKEAISELESMLKGKFGEASSTVVLEEFLSGIEFSLFAITDGNHYRILPQAKDYKRIGEGDTGLNTGGMGAISPVSFLTPDFLKVVEDKIVKPTIAGISAEKMNYKGFVFFGLIKVGNEPFVIEYNCRMGDPETEAVLPRLDEDLLALFESLFTGQLSNGYCREKAFNAATIVLVSGGYPEAFEKGKSINIPDHIHPDVDVYHAGTKNVEGRLLTSGGRVLALTGKGESQEAALKLANEVADAIQFDGKYFRRDIGFDL